MNKSTSFMFMPFVRGSRIHWWLAGLALLGASGARAAEPRWLKLSSSNFELFTTDSERRGRATLLHFEQVRSFFLEISHGKPAAGPRVRVVGFQSEKEFKPYRINDFATAFYATGRNRDYIVMSSIAPEKMPVAIHEYVHLLIKPAHREIPAWLNEGLAELYSTLKPVGSKVQFGDILPGRYQLLQQKKWLDLATLLAVDQKSPYYNERERAGIFYAQSWALTHMLVLNQEYRPKFGVFLDTIVSGTGAADAFERVYGKPVPEVEKGLRNYLGRSQFNVGIYNTKLEKSAEQPEIGAAPPAEAALLLADILAATNKGQEAAEAYTAAAREYPTRPEAEEGLGYVALRARDLDGARRHFARAVERKSGDAQLYFDYARLVGRPLEMVPLLKKAVELRPEFFEAQYNLAVAYVNQREYAAAVQVLASVKHVDRERAEAFFRTAAYAYYGAGNLTEARKGAERSRQYAPKDADTAWVDDFLRMLDRPRPATTAPEPVEAAPVNPASDEAPRLTRQLRDRTAPEKPAAPSTRTIEGALEQVDCLGKTARLRVRSDGRQSSFAILDPNRIVLTGNLSGPVEFSCGPQKSRAIKLEYRPQQDAALGTAGVVVGIEFK